jgi:hypothetical protein
MRRVHKPAKMPWSQLATAELLAVTLLLVAVWAVRKRKY